MTDSPFHAARAIWQTDTPPRVWSFLVTLFGDIAQAPDTYLSGTAINAILREIHIKPEAIRVALYRLRRDGWIDSTKVGRKSNYSLTRWGLEQCRSANAQIYGPWPEQNTAYLIATETSGCNGLGTDAYQITPNFAVACNDPQDQSALVVRLHDADHIPAWIGNALYPEDLQSAAALFENQIKAFAALDLSSAALSPIQTAVLRTLIVHDWRRIILKVPNLPDSFLPSDFLKTEGRRFVVSTLGRLHRPDYLGLDEGH